MYVRLLSKIVIHPLWERDPVKIPDGTRRWPIIAARNQARQDLAHPPSSACMSPSPPATRGAP